MTEHPSARWRSFRKPPQSKASACAASQDKDGPVWAWLLSSRCCLANKALACLTMTVAKQLGPQLQTVLDMHTHRADLRGRPCFKINPPVHSGLHSAWTLWPQTHCMQLTAYP